MKALASNRHDCRNRGWALFSSVLIERRTLEFSLRLVKKQREREREIEKNKHFLVTVAFRNSLDRCFGFFSLPSFFPFFSFPSSNCQRRREES